MGLSLPRCTWCSPAPLHRCAPLVRGRSTGHTHPVGRRAPVDDRLADYRRGAGRRRHLKRRGVSERCMRQDRAKSRSSPSSSCGASSGTKWQSERRWTCAWGNNWCHGVKTSSPNRTGSVGANVFSRNSPRMASARRAAQGSPIGPPLVVDDERDVTWLQRVEEGGQARRVALDRVKLGRVGRSRAPRRRLRR